MFASSTRSFPEFSKQMLTRKAFYHDETSTIHPSTMAIYHFLCTFKVRFSTTDHRTNKNHLNKNPTINGTTRTDDCDNCSDETRQRSQFPPNWVLKRRPTP
uniref:(northern house mosquito) hypothetical protein n=1 Tax=Culex pipiens TaxID=7175 RepID=A0A8D8AWI8_CULPI